MEVNSYKDLIVWQKAMDVVVAVYQMTGLMPDEEKYGLISQMRRSAVSIPSNIAEGRSRGSKAEYVRFLRHSYGSGSELETQLEISKKLNYIEQTKYLEISYQLSEVMKMLNKTIQTLSAPNT